MASHAIAMDDLQYKEVAGQRLLGFLFFLISDCVIFGSFIFVYLYDRNASPVWPPAGTERPDVIFG